MIRWYRHKAGLTQCQLAKKAGMSVGAVRDLEQGRRFRPRPDSVTALARALDLDGDQAAGLAQAAVPPRRRRRDTRHVAKQPELMLREPSDPAMSSRGLWVAVLGPLEARLDGTSFSLGPFARRAVLGLLAVQPGNAVHRDTMIDVLWGESPPPTAVSLVQAHVSRLRKQLTTPRYSSSGGSVIESSGATYRLRLSSDELDLLSFQEFAAEAGCARADGECRKACELYGRAVALWRGAPLADLDLPTDPSRAGVAQQFVDVLAAYAKVACDLGEPHRVLSWLRAGVAIDPLNERLRAWLMIALAASGQQAAAIQAYEDLRRRLDTELGLHPSDELAAAHLRVLRREIPVVGMPTR